MPRRDDEIPAGYVAIGRVLGAVGVRGEIKVQPLAPAAQFKPAGKVMLDGRLYRIERSRPAGRHLALKLAGLDVREEAAAHHGRYLLAAESDLAPLPPDEYYHYQLIGLHVETTAGEALGQVAEVFATAGNDVFVVRGGPRGEILVPAIEDVVLKIDVPAGRILIEPVEGLLPEPRP